MTHLERFLAWLRIRTEYEVLDGIRREAILLALRRWP